MAPREEPPPAVEVEDPDAARKRALQIDMTPVKDAHKEQRIEHTPVGREVDVYKFFCPLCMYYLKEIFETGCCHHYVCYSCSVQFLRGMLRWRVIRPWLLWAAASTKPDVPCAFACVCVYDRPGNPSRVPALLARTVA